MDPLLTLNKGNFSAPHLKYKRNTKTVNLKCVDEFEAECSEEKGNKATKIPEANYLSENNSVLTVLCFQ